MGIDLHAHTSASDGTLTPAELLHDAALAGLTAVAITDHDTTEGWAEAERACRPGLAVVRGVELSCRSGDVSLHLLGYLFDPSYRPLVAAMERLRESRVGRARRMVAGLVAAGLPVTWEQVQRIAGGVVGRPHIAQALVGAGLVGSIEEAFGPEWIGTRGRYWVDREELEVLEALRLVREAGGVSVFAHPGAAARGRIVGDEVIAQLAAAGLDGIEVEHPDHLPQMRAHLTRLAGELGLVTTGSSDFHGSNKAVRLGQERTAPEALERLVARASGVPVLQG